MVDGREALRAELYELQEKKAQISVKIIELQHEQIDLRDERNELNKRIEQILLELQTDGNSL